ncbi:PhzF family phenazine biosynthesis protein [Aspergillus luchuensis]|uniref:Phenazine biosynthesis-like protein n=1 Tax=Aspergillus kawachii TaxID=1069201 RepID=A0A146G2S5_ASPKA|nr:uncharacterized protein AKAW2_20300S [Aspergillus luchuensis]BCR95360.1 hypothetical protein AKAW2_20300S [Aspergillus luchuensis]BCS07909.1 hypothetical protein ALUC_20279S [Aspergillus luchuensis]GAA92002.1 phenazine biosynthesis-like protein [Aspergillus luchuensis IFO 4308]GAT31141.1 phenazine biosynthesis-like protein [Aspergillus luchuensis]
MFLDYVVVDVFTNTRFLGNPLAIVLVPAKHRKTLTQITKQKIAVEFNLSETIFLHEPSEDNSEAIESLAIDTFTPKCEIPFAGHPTIGAAAYIFRHYKRGSATLKNLVTKAGSIPVSQDVVSGILSASIPFECHLHRTPVKSNLVADGAAPIISLVKGLSFVLAELADIDSLASVTTGLLEDCVNIEALDDGWNCGLTGTKYFVDLGNDENGCKQLRTRMFVTWEDPGTGSASSALACFLALREDKEQGIGPFHYHVIQGVEMGRRNDIFVSVTRSEDGERVTEILLRGDSVLVSEGRISADSPSEQ